MRPPIYEPKGAAKEYGELALNIYTGCPHRCFYCIHALKLCDEHYACMYCELREDKEVCVGENFGTIAKLIHALQSELTKVTAERDAAVKDLTSMAKNDRHDVWSCLFCKNRTDFCLGGCNWEWRGVQNGGIIANSGD